jgi:hypothetical protein
MATAKKKKEAPSVKQSPLAVVREQFKTKEALVDRLMAVVEAGGAAKEDLKARFLAASNKKLLRLLQVASDVKSQFGSSEKLAQAAAEAVGKAKDKAYVQKLAQLAARQPARVLDLLRSAQARAKKAARA